MGSHHLGVSIVSRLAMTPARKNRVMIFGPKDDGTYVVEFKTAEGEALAGLDPRSEAHLIRHFGSGCLGLFVPEVQLRPGGNVNGFINLEPSVSGKFLELLKEIALRVH